MSTSSVVLYLATRLHLCETSYYRKKVTPSIIASHTCELLDGNCLHASVRTEPLTARIVRQKELLQAIVVCVHDEYVAVTVEGHTLR